MHMIRCIERMGDQCVNIAKLVPLSDGRRDAELVYAIDRMGKLARQRLADAKDVFKTRHVSLAKHPIAEDVGISRLNREVCTRAVDIGDDRDAREWAMFMILAARALERISDNPVDISAATARNALLPLRAICRRALSRGDIQVNPTMGIEIPAVRGRRMRFATPQEA